MKFIDIALDGKIYKLEESGHKGCLGCAFEDDDKQCKAANAIHPCGEFNVYVEVKNESKNVEQKEDKKKSFIIKNMSNGRIITGFETPNDIEAAAKEYAAKEPGSEFWVYEKQYAVKAQVPVVVIKD